MYCCGIPVVIFRLVVFPVLGWTLRKFYLGKTQGVLSLFLVILALLCCNCIKCSPMQQEWSNSDIVSPKKRPQLHSGPEVDYLPALPPEVMQYIWDKSPLQVRARLRTSDKNFNPTLTNNGESSPFRRIRVTVPELFNRAYPGRKGFELPHILYHFCIWDFKTKEILQAAFPGPQGVFDCLNEVDSFFLQPNPISDVFNSSSLNNAKIQIIYLLFDHWAYVEHDIDYLDMFYFLTTDVKQWTLRQRRAVLTFFSEFHFCSPIFCEDHFDWSVMALNFFCPSKMEALVEVFDCDYAYARMHQLDVYDPADHSSDPSILRDIRYNFESDLKSIYSEYVALHVNLCTPREFFKPSDLALVFEAIDRGASVHRQCLPGKDDSNVDLVFFTPSTIKVMAKSGVIPVYIQSLVDLGVKLDSKGQKCTLLRKAVATIQERSWIAEHNVLYMSHMLKSGSFAYTTYDDLCLQSAVIANMLPDSQWLVNHGYPVEPNFFYRRPLNVVASSDMLQMLIINGANINRADIGEVCNTALQKAVYNRKIDIIRSILEVNEPEKVNVNYRDNFGVTALMYANDLTTVKLLLGKGADPSLHDIFGVSPLFKRKRLLDKSLWYISVDSDKYLVLNLFKEMLEFRDPASITELVAFGASVHSRDNILSWTPLEYAIEWDKYQVMKTLVSLGALASLNDESKARLIKLAVKANDFPFVENLLDLGVDRKQIAVLVELLKK